MPKLDDTADALAIAICHSYSYKYNQVMYNSQMPPGQL